DQARCFSPVQLKELVPESLNTSASIEQLITGLHKYSSEHLTVAIFLNRQGRFVPAEIAVPSLRLGKV
ncbi:MAG: hypothetical protein ACK50S_01135, partial [bacterium]